MDERALVEAAQPEPASSICQGGEFRDRLRRDFARSINMTLADMSTSSRGVRAGSSTITPYLMAPDIEPVIAFAKAVFGAEERSVRPVAAGAFTSTYALG
jgi:hypothetical protein